MLDYRTKDLIAEILKEVEISGKMEIEVSKEEFKLLESLYFGTCVEVSNIKILMGTIANHTCYIHLLDPESQKLSIDDQIRTMNKRQIRVTQTNNEKE